MATPGSLAGFATPVASAAHGPFQVLLAVFFVAVCVAVAAVVDLGVGLLVLAVGGAIIAGVMQLARDPSPELLPLEEPQAHDLVQLAVGREERPAVDRPAALEVRRASAGLLDEDHRRGGVPRRQLDLDHRLGGALGQQRIAPEVAEAALAPDVAQERPRSPAPGPTRRCPAPEP